MLEETSAVDNIERRDGVNLEVSYHTKNILSEYTESNKILLILIYL